MANQKRKKEILFCIIQNMERVNWKFRSDTTKLDVSYYEEFYRKKSKKTKLYCAWP